MSSKQWRNIFITFLIQFFIFKPLLWISRVVVSYTTRNQQKRTERRYLSILDSTEDHQTWSSTALSLDLLRGFKKWHCTIPTSSYCNPAALIYETNVAIELARIGNVRAIGEFLRTMLHRRVNGVASPLLFRYYTGTKDFVENYNIAIHDLIEVFSGRREEMTPLGSSTSTANSDTKSEFVEDLLLWAKNTAGTQEAQMTPREKQELLCDTAHSFGVTALMLSGGASLGMYHIGVVRALFEAGLLPRIISGSSAGSIIAAVICTRTDADLSTMLVGNGLSLGEIHLNAFEVNDSPEESIGKKFDRLLASGAFMDVETLMLCLQRNCGDLTFLEAYRMTGRILNVSVANNRPGDHIDKHMLLNYITASNVVIWSAVAASCAMPGLFTAVQLLEKNGSEIVPYLPGQLWFDGSVARDLPREELSTTFNVNYFLVSQTNPHVIPFLRKPPSPIVHKKRSGIFKRCWFAVCSEARHWLLKSYRVGLLPKSGGAEVPYLMATQCYSGDITILPIGSVWSAIPDFINLTSNPSEEHMAYVISNAQRRTWPHINQIRWITCVERALLREYEHLSFAV
ncbi:patatin-like phospholipase, putative [Bodo saltans]|uniref:Patatin-like phospholipase, putative n=1 Tax=Bodo saltans TaxID=75058 RepID=A0A0S4JR20_BODSA|nr:patatin-like phospholipase, putative [Bodo saltans]|eukprot:CUG91518.1 patatin-like phospholipase, putative [Bodo saltans]